MPCFPVRVARGSRLALLLASCVAMAAPAVAQPPRARASAAQPAASAATTLVLLVRHGEKASAPADDPLLSEAGARRAAALQVALADAGVRHVVVSPRRRTIDTARPLADALGLQPEVVALGTNGAEHVRAVAEAVRRRPIGDVVLVVGHSNTIPAIVGALGGPRLPDLCDAQYSALYLLAVPAQGPARLVRSSYGAADPVDAASCGATGPR